MARPGDDDDPRLSDLRSHSNSHSRSNSHSHSRSISRSNSQTVPDRVAQYDKEAQYVHHARSESQVGLRESEGDLRLSAPDRPKVEVEYETPNTVKGIWLGTYFFFSLMLTLYNKLILGSVSAALLGYFQTYFSISTYFDISGGVH